MTSFKKFFLPYSSILFLQHPLLGIALFILSFHHLSIGFGGLISLLLVRLLSSYLLPLPAGKEILSVQTNALLVGMALGYGFKLTLMMTILLLLMVSLCMLLTLLVHKLFALFDWPVMSFPFSLITILLFVMGYRLVFFHFLEWNTHILSEANWLDFYLPQVVKIALKTLGFLLFSHSSQVGLALFILIFLFSPLGALLLLLGVYSGIGIESLLQQGLSPLEYCDYLFNYPLLALALVGILLVPSPRALAILFLGIGVTAAISNGLFGFWYTNGIPIFSLPFKLSILLLLNGLRQTRATLLSPHQSSTPEDNQDFDWNQTRRFQSQTPCVQLPFRSSALPIKCQWQVTQGNDDKWTHQGPWQFALDFEVSLSLDYSHPGPQEISRFHPLQSSGHQLKDYFTFGQEVLSPLSGTIIACEGNLHDNPIGQINAQANWGNFVMIKSFSGIYVVLAHLAQGSLQVFLGQTVKTGQLLGLCGNSGLSFYPHLHLQVQLSPLLDAPTIPFTLETYATFDTDSKQEFHFYSFPPKGAKIANISPYPPLWNALNFPLGMEMVYRHQQGTEIKVLVKMDSETGKLYLLAEEAPEKFSRLYFHLKSDHFYCYDYQGPPQGLLATLYLCLPRFPLTPSNQFQWTELLPLRLCHSPLNLLWQRTKLLLTGIGPHPQGHYHLENSGRKIRGNVHIRGQEISSAGELDPMGGIQVLQLGSIEYTRIR